MPCLGRESQMRADENEWAVARVSRSEMGTPWVSMGYGEEEDVRIRRRTEAWSRRTRRVETKPSPPGWIDERE